MEYHGLELSLMDYLTKYGSFRTALSDFYIKTRNCKIIGVDDAQNVAVGLLLAEQGAVTEILILAAQNDEVKIKTALLDRLKELLPSYSELRWRIVNHPQNEELALAYGFRTGSVLNIFHTVGSDNERAEATLREYEKLYAKMEATGFRTVSFAQLSENELAQIRDNPDGEFDSSLCPESLMVSGMGGLSPQMSFAAMKDGRVVAYSIIRSPDEKSYIFEIICVAKSERGNGIFILPFFRSLREIMASAAASATFAIYESNQIMLEILEKRFSQLIVSRTVQKNMVYFIS